MGIGIFARPWLPADRMLQLVGRYIQLMRVLRMTDSLFFIYMKMEPNSVSLEFKRLTPTSGKHLNQT